MTITLDDDTALWARIEAAKRDTSVSRFVGDLLRSRRLDDESYDRARQAYQKRRRHVISEPGQPYPTRDEVHQR